MTEQPSRLPLGGRIDRSKTLSVRFDGREISAHPGDTLASALLANGTMLVGRSFKYHRPRGILSAGVEEPNALVRLRSGARAEPNTRATVAEAYEGMEARSQNRWPRLGFDIGAINDYSSRFLAAGFYYKTFIGPGRGTSAWMFYEKFIRRAAGMGRATKEPDLDSYEKINTFADVLVIGSGPAGLCAALAAGRTGARVILAEQDFEIGGSLLLEPQDSPQAVWLSVIHEELMSLKNVQLMTRTTVFGAYEGGNFGLLERVWDHVATPPDYQPRQRYYMLHTKTAILASGAIEQPLVFGGNDIPGVMLASATRTYLNRYAVLSGRNIVVAANNDSAFAVAHDLAKAGATVSLVDPRPDINRSMTKLLRRDGVEVIAGHAVRRARGRQRLTGVDIAPVDILTGQSSGVSRWLSADLLAVSGGWAPSLHLWSQLGQKPSFDFVAGAYFPNTDKISKFICTGMMSPDHPGDVPSKHWFHDGANAAYLSGYANQAGDVPALPATPFTGLTRAGCPTLWAVTDKNGDLFGKAFLDLQHDTTVGDIDLAHREGMQSVEHTKRYTTAGMATDQGKTANLNVLARMAKLQGIGLGDVGTTSFRPPYTPVSFGALIGNNRGSHVAPTRLSAIHEWHVDRGAKFISAGAWMRPRYYPRGGESIRDAYTREAAHVRTHVGLVDVSTLGKIAIGGVDSGTFLDRIYVNGFKSLKVGRIRYGVMLREDGIVLDDGTTARLTDKDYFMSTTTANAARVLSHLEFLHQTAWPDLKVQLTSVTDQWAAIAIAGPKSRQLLQSATTSVDLSAEAFPNMSFIEAQLGGMPVRIHRMSFSGELAYEVYVGSGWGQAVWETLIRVGEPFDVIPYGTEAMGTLRIEKGHVSAPELDGRTSIGNLGMARMASTKKQYIGSVLRNRLAHLDPDRSALVGLEALSGDLELKPGMLLFPENVSISGHGEGFVSSVTWSPALNKPIGLGLFVRGQDRIGEIIRCVDFLDDIAITVRVTSPHFFDPEGKRQNG